jgi:hypothetical protein
MSAVATRTQGGDALLRLAGTPAWDTIPSSRKKTTSEMLYDAFISHATEDKDSFVRPLAECLRQKRVEVWYDEFTLMPGMSLRKSIDHGPRKIALWNRHFEPSVFRKVLAGVGAKRACPKAYLGVAKRNPSCVAPNH